MSRHLRCTTILLIVVALLGCTRTAGEPGEQPGSGAAVSSTLAGPVASATATLPATVKAGDEEETRSVTKATPTEEAVAPTVGTLLPEALTSLPVTLSLPQGWALQEVGKAVIAVPEEACLTGAELECPVLEVRPVPGATRPSDVLAAYDLSGALRQETIPLVIAGNPVEAIDATFISESSGRVYQVVLAPVMVHGQGLLFIAAMPEGQAKDAWPVLATMLGDVQALED